MIEEFKGTSAASVCAMPRNVECMNAGVGVGPGTSSGCPVAPTLWRLKKLPALVCLLTHAHSAQPPHSETGFFDSALSGAELYRDTPSPS